jgi:hypothetical protein
MKDDVNRATGTKETFIKGTKYYLIAEPEYSGVKVHECKSDGLKNWTEIDPTPIQL